ncbi:hypothetical protein BDV98DRAFT_557128 [Pterulicium gracile]|uniref:MARVEL domain-containing protein n=1 Tax=Pterulicium gracile TaxID=1884261 RepID=A0A5C3QYE7_9AGAR|nr:hypothetical protein BDV98DRAFT_557128 [Pterula gracilis]
MRVQLWKLIRICFFAWQVIANAIICSVGVWQLSTTSGLAIDKYLIFLGAFSLVFVFGIIFIELLVDNPITSRLWFELLWVGIFSVMQLAGAVALCVKHESLCKVDALACQSSQVLLAFIWICFMTLASYTILLAFPAYRCQASDSRVWNHPVNRFRWSNQRKCRLHSPSSPTAQAKPRFNQDDFVVAAPVARRAQNPLSYTHRFGLGSDYEIEHYRPPSHHGAKQVSLNDPPLPTQTAPIAQPAPIQTPHALDMTSNAGPSLHPERMKAAFLPSRREPVQPQPLRPIRREPSPKQPDTMHVSAPPEQKQAGHVASDHRGFEDVQKPTELDLRRASASSRVKPSGPRRQSASSGGGPTSFRPPPLKLEHISSYGDPHG